MREGTQFPPPPHTLSHVASHLSPTPNPPTPSARSIGPGLVSTLWGIFVFGELKGTKNYLLVTGAFVLIATAATLIALSN